MDEAKKNRRNVARVETRLERRCEVQMQMKKRVNKRLTGVEAEARRPTASETSDVSASDRVMQRFLTVCNTCFAFAAEHGHEYGRRKK